ncbi:hypothetical protein mRhiFer1_007873 [Rhinolophus ferrumequinum]|uniref:Uncharacterized protein n=1 Tax=Rhinolophus ferrumequinum TaxID=59479 RepID=A0A7J8AVJ8_RHIFE|nr:hypothetical protein mRhiFer1_007873 [Rhinolophus ferrumequinum]
MASDSGQDMWPPHSAWYLVATVLRSWTPEEGWEVMDGSLASVERAVQALAEWLPVEVKGTAVYVGWMFLTTLCNNMEDGLNEIAQVPDQQPWGEALEAWDCQLEEVLTTVHHNSEEALAGIAQVQDQVSWWEALEARVRLLEEEPHSGDSEAQVEEASGDNVAPYPQASPILKQKVKHEQPLDPGGIAAGNAAVTQFTAYTPYTHT